MRTVHPSKPFISLLRDRLRVKDSAWGWSLIYYDSVRVLIFDTYVSLGCIYTFRDFTTCPLAVIETRGNVSETFGI